MCEGSHWATNWEIFDEVWDHNSCLQFHEYWLPPDTAKIQKFLDARKALGLPIYMGEGGENNVEWLYTAWRLYEGNNIGWNFWPWKKIDTATSPASIRRTGVGPSRYPAAKSMRLRELERDYAVTSEVAQSGVIHVTFAP